ncbi:HAMP domain-containing histidine kinase [Plantibacter flavus]|uniref:sensor histidine kinase n=1 Tax=Plantibacter flavus TaxID=150123 RepID=UPI003F15C140
MAARTRRRHGVLGTDDDAPVVVAARTGRRHGVLGTDDDAPRGATPARRRRHHGIRTRIAGGSLLIAFVVSLFAGLVINAQLERIVRDGTVQALRSDGAQYVFALQARPDEPLQGPGLGTRIAVVAPDGSIPVFSLPTTLAAQIPALAVREGVSTADAGGATYILLSQPVSVAGETWYVVAGRDEAEETTVLVQMRLLLIGSFALLVLGIGAGGWVLATVSLRPVTRLRVSAQSLSERSTAELLPVGRADDEIAQLAITLNHLIERLRASAERERQLVSDASHELRTPLAILRTQLELARLEDSSREQLLTDIEGAERSATRLSALVTSLLELSRIEAATPPPLTSAAALDAGVLEAVERARFRAGAGAGAGSHSGSGSGSVSGGRDVDVRIDHVASLVGDGLGAGYAVHADDYGRIVDNLTGNALQAIAERAGTADRDWVPELIVSLVEGDGMLVLRVSDTGGGLDPAFESRAFERFSRPDATRAAGHGAGLGLAIVAAIVRNAGGTIELRNRPGVGLEVVVTLPAVPALDAPSRVVGS